MARRKPKRDESYLKVLVVSVLVLSYIMQPYVEASDSTFAHTYYKELFSKFYDTLSYTPVYAQDPVQIVNNVLNQNGLECLNEIQKLVLNWNENSNPSGTQYRIDRSTDGGFSYTNIRNVTGSSHTDDNNGAGLPADINIFYRIYSLNAESVPNGPTSGNAFTLPNAPANLIRDYQNLNMIPGTVPTVVLDWDNCGNNENSATGTRYRLESELTDPAGNAMPGQIYDNIIGSQLFAKTVANGGNLLANAYYASKVKSLNRADPPEETSSTNTVNFWSPVNNPLNPWASAGTLPGAVEFSWYANSNLLGTKYIVCRAGPANQNDFKCLSPIENLGVTLGPCPNPGNNPADIELALRTCAIDAYQLDPTKQQNIYRDITVGGGSTYSYKVMAISAACSLSGAQEGCFISDTTAPVTVDVNKNAVYLDYQSDWSIPTRVTPSMTQTSVLAGTSTYYGDIVANNGALGLSKNPAGGITGDEYLTSGTAIYTFQSPSPVYWKNFLYHYGKLPNGIKLEWCATNTPTTSVCLGGSWHTINGQSTSGQNEKSGTFPFSNSVNKYLLVKITLSGDGTDTPILNDMRIEYSKIP